ncbi:MAG: diguanylate cyclase [Betaproteobacteria bacterium]
MNFSGVTALLKVPFHITVCVLSLVTIVACAGAWVATGHFASHRVERQIQSLREKTQTEADITANSLDKKLSAAKSIAVVLASDPSIKTELVRFGTDIKASKLPLEERARVWSLEPALASLADRMTLIVNRFDLNSTWISNASGDAVAEGHAVGVPPFVGTNYSDRDYFKMAQQGQNGLQFAIGRVTNRYSLFFSSPVSVEGRFVGMVGVNFQLLKLSEGLKDSDAFVTDENGVVVLAKDSTLLMKAVPTAQANALSSDELDKRYKRRDFENLNLVATSDEIANGLYQWQQKASPHVLARQTAVDGFLHVYVLTNIDEILISAHRDRLWQFALVSLVTLLLSVVIGGGVWYVITTRRQQDKLMQLNKTLDKQANTDTLTGLANRRHFMSQAEQELARTIRYGGEMSVLMVDIDNFKLVNDTHGHQIGDRVLQAVAQIFQTTLREVDFVGRVGGEEFAVVFPETGIMQAFEVAERLRRAVEQTEIALDRGLPLAVTVSVGMTSRGGTNANIDTLLSRADKALYEAKREGRNQVCIYEIGKQNEAD